jgi:predicted component of type VI protein secretion system
MQSGAGYRLVVRRGPQPNQQYVLTRETVTIGRDITNDVVINDPEISRHHTRLIRTPGGYTAEDLKSTNGTFVNRQRINAPYQLSNGDLVGLGETVTLSFETEAEGVASTMVASRGQEPAAASAAVPPPVVMQSPAPVAPQMVEAGEGTDRNRWIVIGCGIMTLVFCCAVVGAFVAIDALKLWCDIPVLGSLVGCK